jgi:Virulence activator alpha C-term
LASSTPPAGRRISPPQIPKLNPSTEFAHPTRLPGARSTRCYRVSWRPDSRACERSNCAAVPTRRSTLFTPAGLESLRTWLEDVDEEPTGGQVVFALKVFLYDFASSATALAQLAAYRRFLERRLEAYEQFEADSAGSPRGYPEHVLQNGLTRVRATLAWIDETTAAIAREQLGRTLMG